MPVGPAQAGLLAVGLCVHRCVVSFQVRVHAGAVGLHGGSCVCLLHTQLHYCTTALQRNLQQLLFGGGLVPSMNINCENLCTENRQT